MAVITQDGGNHTRWPRLHKMAAITQDGRDHIRWRRSQDGGDHTRWRVETNYFLEENKPDTVKVQTNVKFVDIRKQKIQELKLITMILQKKRQISTQQFRLVN